QLSLSFAVAMTVALAALVAAPPQRCGQLLLQHRLDEAPHTAPQLRFDRVEPSLPGKQRLGSARGRDILVHGVVSCRRVNAGLGLLVSTGDYATPIPTTSATAPSAARSLIAGNRRPLSAAN